MYKIFKQGIVEVAYKGATTDVKVLVSATGIEAAYPIVKFCKDNQTFPIVSITKTLDEISILRIFIPNHIINNQKQLDELVME